VADVDKPRYIAAIGYTHNVRAAIDKLEAVPADFQRELSQRARLDELRRTREAWSSTITSVEAALSAFAQVADPRLGPGVRGVQKGLRRLGHQVDRLEPLDDDG
jgi:hypothetical protein